MTDPERALELARQAVEEARGRGELEDEPGEAAVALERQLAAERPSDELLLEWALIRVDPDVVYSTRRGGGSMTALKRGLLRLLRQYTNELEAQQTRFNLALLARLGELERRDDTQ